MKHSRSANTIIDLLKKVKAIYTDDHFVYTSGKHGSIYINKDALYPHTKVTSQVGLLFAKKFKNKNIEVVVAPAVGGTILSQWTAYHLSKLKKKEILSVYTEKDKGTLAAAADSQHIFRRGYDKLVKGKNVLVIEDLTTTGISVKKVVKAVRNIGGKVIAVGVMVNRNPQEVNKRFFSVTFYALGTLKADAYEPNDCPLCKKRLPINTEIGHGKEFLAKQKK